MSHKTCPLHILLLNMHTHNPDIGADLKRLSDKLKDFIIPINNTAEKVKISEFIAIFIHTYPFLFTDNKNIECAANFIEKYDLMATLKQYQDLAKKYKPSLPDKNQPRHSK